MAFTLPQYMQQDPIMSGQRKGTSRTAPQSMSSLLEILNKMPKFEAQGVGEQKIRDLYGGSIGAARAFGMEQNRATAGERGAAPEPSGVARQKATRLGLFTQAPMLKEIIDDLKNQYSTENSYLAQLYAQLMQSASGPISEASDESTTWRAPTGAEINLQTPRVQYPSQGGGGGGGTLGGSKMGGLSNNDWWSRASGPREALWSGGGGANLQPEVIGGPRLMSDEGIGSDSGYRAPGGVSLPRTPQASEQWATGGLASPNVWNMPQELMFGAGLQTSGGDDYEYTQGGTGGSTFQARRRKGETGAYSRF